MSQPHPPPPLVDAGTVDTQVREGVATVTLMRAPMAERLERRPSSRSVAQWLPWPGLV